MQDRTTMAVASNWNEVLTFWFDEIEPRQHFIKDERFDREISRRFRSVYDQLCTCYAEFDGDCDSILAAILVFDQFPRNMFRGEAKAFETDPQAVVFANRLIASGEDLTLSAKRRVFAYMPFMHSEDPADQDRAVALFSQLGIVDHLDYALKHQAVIRRYGRFPHRNQALNRHSTPDELQFIATKGTAF